MLNQAIGSSRLWMASMKTNWSTGLSVRVADGRISSEMDTRLPIHITTASMWSQKVNAIAQEGTVGILYDDFVGSGVSDGTSVGAGAFVASVVGASLVEAAPVAVLTGASVAG